MDYVRQELLRQGAVLAALLGGKEETRQEAPEWREAEQAEAGSGPELRRAAAETFPAGQAVGWNTAALAAGGAAGQAGAGERRPSPASAEEAEETAGTGRRRRASEREDRAGDGGPLAAPAAVKGRFGGPAGVSEMEFPEFAGTDGAVLGEVRRWMDAGGSRSAAAAEARAVSRAVERDARRYDGGFSIY